MPIQLLFSVNIKNVKQQKKKNYVLIVYKLCQMPIYTANERPMRIQYMSGSDLCIPSTAQPSFNALPPNFHMHVSMSDLYNPTTGLPKTDSGNI